MLEDRYKKMDILNTRRSCYSSTKYFYYYNWLTISFLILSSLIGYAHLQENQNFYQPTGGNQRFISSSLARLQRENSAKSNLFPTSGTSNLNNGNVETIPEQQEISINTNGDSGVVPTKSPDYYDQPRPFGAANPARKINSFSSLGQTSSSSLSTRGARPNGNTGGSFIPSSQKISTINRGNVPYQQSQFLAQFNDQQSTSSEKPASFPQTNRPRPFGPRIRPFARQTPAPSFPVQPSEESQQVGKFQQLPARSNRNRFQPTSERGKIQIKTTTENEPTSTERSRYNRFGTSPRPNKKQQPQQLQSTQQTLTRQSNVPKSRFSPHSSLTTNKTGSSGFQPKRPVFISREVNEPIHTRNRPSLNKIGGPNPKYLKTFNPSKKQEENQLDDELSEINQITNDQQHKTLIDSLKDLNENHEDRIEKFITTEEPFVSTTVSTTTEHNVDDFDEVLEITDNSDNSDSLDKPMILTSNFFLPGENNQSEEQSNENFMEESKEISDSSNETNNNVEIDPNILVTPKTIDYDNNEEKEMEKFTMTTVIPSLEISENDKKLLENIEMTTEGNRFIQATTFRRDFNKVMENMGQNNDDDDQIDDLKLTTVPTISKDINGMDNDDASIEYVEEYSDEEPESDDEELIEEDEENGNNEDVDDDTLSNEKDVEIVHENEEDKQMDKLSEEEDEKKQEIEMIEKLIEKLENENEDEEKHEINEDEENNKKVNRTISIENESLITPKQDVINETLDNLQSPTPTTTTEGSLESNIQISKPSELASENDQSEISNGEDQGLNNSTEGYVVIASIQTSRSLNGARFLPFPAIEQEEKKQTLSELERKIKSKKTSTQSEQSNDDNEKSVSVESLSETTAVPSQNQEEENITTIPEIIKESSSEVERIVTTTQPTTTTNKLFRKFIPKSATKAPKINFDEIKMDDLSELLPSGFKARPSGFTLRNKKPAITTTKTATTTTTTTEANTNNEKPIRNQTISRSFKNSPVTAQEITVSSLLPKGFKLNESTTESSRKLGGNNVSSKLAFEENNDKFLPKDFKEKNTNKSGPTIVDDVSKFLPPGYKFKPSKYNTSTQKPETQSTTQKVVAVTVKDDISKFLPPDFNLNKNMKEDKIEAIDITQILGKDKVVEIKDISSLLPPGYKPSSDTTVETNKTDSIEIAENSSKSLDSTNNNVKIVFPSSLNKKQQSRVSNSRPKVSGPPPPQITIKKGPPTRATTEFTGWPTPSTTPISIEKLLENARTVDISELLPSSTTTTAKTTTTTTTTTTEAPHPTQPGHCKSECNLAGTIKIVEGVKWTPELLDHNTVEWKTLAKEIEAQLNEVYINAPYLGNWYKKVRIDSFSKGSVLVDYFIELTNITRDVNTQEIKRLFHDALVQTPLTVVPLNSDNSSDDDDDENNNYLEGKGEKLVKETYMLGKYIVDPVATDFIVIPKSRSPTIDFEEQNVLIPQWGIVLIVIGVGSFCFIFIFGITVLLNRNKSAKKKAPSPLTADMLNELNKNHMGGVDNFGAEELYNVDDAWNDTKQPIKSKRIPSSMHGSQSNIYDSWGSNHGGANDYNYYDTSYKPYSTYHQNFKMNPYTTDPVWDAHQMYTYNSRTPRYPRDPNYNPNF